MMEEKWEQYEDLEKTQVEAETEKPGEFIGLKEMK